MKKSFLLTCIIMSIGIAGCGLTNQNAEKVEQVNDSLTVCVTDQDQHLYLEEIEVRWKAEYPDIELHFNLLPSDTSEEESDRISAELMAGEGADIYFNPENIGIDIYKTQEAGAWENLMPWFEKQENFSKDDYVDGTFDLYEKGEACYVFPIRASYGGYALFYSKLEELGLRTEEWSSSEGMLDALEAYYAKYPEDNPFIRYEAYSNGLNGYGYNMGDKMDIAAILESEVFKRDMELYKRQVYPNGVSLAEDPETVDYEHEKEELFREKGNYFGKTFSTRIEDYVKLGGEDAAEIVDLYGADGEIMLSVGNTIAISAGSHNKENAMNFLNLYIELESTDPEMVTGFTNKTMTEEYLRQFQEKWMKDEVLVDGEIYPGLTEKTYQILENGYENGKLSTRYGHTTKLLECMEPYFTGQSEMEPCLKDFRAYLEIYYSE